MHRLAIAVSLLALTLTGCPRAPDGGPGGGPTKEEQRLQKELKQVTALQARVAQLERRVAGGETATPWKIVNFHEHAYKMEHIERYMAAAHSAGIARTVLVASPQFTIFGKGHSKTDGMEENFRVIMEATKRWPGEIIPYATVAAGDPEKLEKFKRYHAEGAKGLKLYNGHTNFFDEKIGLMPEGMFELLQYCADNKLPVLWHVRLSRFLPELEEKVLKKLPNLTLIIAHYGVAFWRPQGKMMDEIPRLLDAYPNLYFDTCLGTRKILVDGIALMGRFKDKFRKLILRNPDRYVIGTDMVITGNPEKTVGWFSRCIWAVRDQLEQDSLVFDLGAAWAKYHPKRGADGDGKMIGLGLPAEALKQIYETTPAKLLGEL